jgi:hypothetical protein
MHLFVWDLGIGLLLRSYLAIVRLTAGDLLKFLGFDDSVWVTCDSFGGDGFSYYS